MCFSASLLWLCHAAPVHQPLAFSPLSGWGRFEADRERKERNCDIKTGKILRSSIPGLYSSFYLQQVKLGAAIQSLQNSHPCACPPSVSTLFLLEQPDRALVYHVWFRLSVPHSSQPLVVQRRRPGSNASTLCISPSKFHAWSIFSASSCKPFAYRLVCVCQ